jgi:hypothetical protein
VDPSPDWALPHGVHLFSVSATGDDDDVPVRLEDRGDGTEGVFVAGPKGAAPTALYFMG